MQTNPVWRMVRALIVTYILSGILLAVLSFALFKFRLPENQVNVAVCAVYVLSVFSGAWSSELSIFCFYISCPSHRRTVSRKTPKDFSLSSPCAH